MRKKITLPIIKKLKKKKAKGKIKEKKLIKGLKQKQVEFQGHKKKTKAKADKKGVWIKWELQKKTKIQRQKKTEVNYLVITPLHPALDVDDTTIIQSLLWFLSPSLLTLVNLLTLNPSLSLSLSFSSSIFIPFSPSNVHSLFFILSLLYYKSTISLLSLSQEVFLVGLQNQINSPSFNNLNLHF